MEAKINDTILYLKGSNRSANMTLVDLLSLKAINPIWVWQDFNQESKK
jgi:hypothetical protein